MGDKIFIIVFYVVVAINAVFIWMRIILKQKGQEYSYIDFSWQVFHAYFDQMSIDKEMKSKLIRFVFIDCVILILISTLSIML